MKLTLAVALTLGLAGALTEADAALADWSAGLSTERRAKKGDSDDKKKAGGDGKKARDAKKGKGDKAKGKEDTKAREKKVKEQNQGGPPASRAGVPPDGTSLWGKADPFKRQEEAGNRAGGGLCTGTEVKVPEQPLPSPKEQDWVYVPKEHTCGPSKQGDEGGPMNSCNCPVSYCCMNMWSGDSFKVEGYNDPNGNNGAWTGKPYICMSFIEGGKGNGVGTGILSSCLAVSSSSGTGGGAVPGAGGLRGRL